MYMFAIFSVKTTEWISMELFNNIAYKPEQHTGFSAGVQQYSVLHHASLAEV